MTTVAAVGLSLKQGNAEISSTQSPINRNVQRDRDGHSDLLCVANGLMMLPTATCDQGMPERRSGDQGRSGLAGTLRGPKGA